jgi:hypothetical protein
MGRYLSGTCPYECSIRPITAPLLSNKHKWSIIQAERSDAAHDRREIIKYKIKM